MHKRTTVLLLFGGKSSEHEVSILSAKNVFSAINRNEFEVQLGFIDKNGIWRLLEDFEQYKAPNSAPQILPLLGEKGFKKADGQILNPDVILPIMHGENCEDGAVQGLAKLLEIPIVGCQIAASAICMDKTLAKQILDHNGIKTTPYVIHNKYDKTPNYTEISKKLSATLFIKPAGCGSSVGVAKAQNEEEFKEAVENALKYDDKILIEQAVDAREIEIAVLGNTGDSKASCAGEIKPGKDFYDYEDKYADSSDSQAVIPAEIPDEISDKIRQTAVKAYQILGCAGLSRVDFFLMSNGAFYLNEINTLPGFTNISMYPKLWQHDGIAYPELIEQLILLALDKKDLVETAQL